MTEEAKRNLGVSISSTNVPTIQMGEDELSLSFLNWDYGEIQLDFESTLAFRWSSLSSANEIDDDTAFEVLNSKWLKEVLFDESVNDQQVFRHYQFYVYDCWLFEVIATGFEVSKEEQEEPEFSQESWSKCVF